MSPPSYNDRTDKSSNQTNKQKIVNRFARSLNTKYEPIITNKGCKDKMTMELATEVYTKDSIQNKKCNPRKRPAKKTVPQSFLVIFKERSIFQGRKGSMNMTDIYNLNIPATEVGVCEDFIMMEETETDKILMNSKKYGCKDSDILFIFIMILSDVLTNSLCTEQLHNKLN